MPPINHAVLGASKAYQWIACPPSAKINAAIPEQPSKYAAEGTQAHELCEQFLHAGLAEWETGDGGTMVPIDGYQPEMVNAATVYRDFVHEAWAGFEHEPGMFVEQKVRFARWVPEGFGTCDCLLIGDGVLHIIDFKYGVGVPVSPERNPQMMCYALGAYAMFEATDQIDTIRMSIVQPRIQEEPETAEMSTADLLAWAKDTLAPAAKLAWAGDGEMHADEKTCRFCKNYPQCTAWKDKYGPLADFNPLPEPTELTPDALGDWLTKVRGLAAYAKDLEDYALAELMDGATVPGWKAIEGVSRRVFTDADAAFEAIAAAGYNETLLYKPRERITLTEAEKLLGKKNFTAVCGSLVDKPAGAPKLAPESDKHPAINKLEGFKEEAAE